MYAHRGRDQQQKAPQEPTSYDSESRITYGAPQQS